MTIVFPLLCCFVLLVGGSGVEGVGCYPGKDCISQQICTGNITECAQGTYCAGSDQGAILCTKGYYCPTPLQQIQCPNNYWCPTASISATECIAGSTCPAGSFKQQWYLLIILIGVFVFLLILIYVRVSRKTNVNSSTNVHAVASSVKISLEQSTTLRSTEFNVDFTNLGASVNENGKKKQLISNVTGSFRSGRLTAVMGPSGSGKTSLLRILTGKIPHSEGKILINGTEEKIEKYKKLVGFVPQADVMLRQLTVYEVIQHSANLRLPASWTALQRENQINEVLNVLKIDHIRNSIIGDEISRGISGGERKRVNIAMELVADPALLFLDEPTTGLDSTASQQIMSSLKQIAQRGVTVVAVIHQPRFEILELCDDILLLQKGGKVIFGGESNKVYAHFQQQGYRFPDPPFNPADFILDIVSGEIKEEANFVGVQQPQTISDSSSSNIAIGSTGVTISIGNNTPPTQRVTPNFFVQLRFYFGRCVVVQKRSLKNLFLEILYQLIPGITMGASAMGYELFLPPVPDSIAQFCPDIIRDRCYNESLSGNTILVNVFFLTMVTGAASSITANTTFGYEKLNYYREASWGAYPLAYFLAKCFYELWNIARTTLIFLAFYLYFASPQGSFGMWFGAIFFMQWAIYGMGYFISLLMDMQSSLVLSPVLAMAFSITSGLSPTLYDIKGTVILEIIWWLSYNRWTSEALYITGTSHWPYLKVRNTIVNAGYNPDNYGTDLAMLFFIGVLWRIAAFLALVFKDRDKKK